MDLSELPAEPTQIGRKKVSIMRVGAVSALTFAMLCTSCSGEQTPFGEVGSKFGHPEHSEMLLSQDETVDGACMVAFTAQPSATATSSEDFIFVIYSADRDIIRQKISFKFDMESNDVLKELAKLTVVSPAAAEIKNDDIIKIKMDHFEISPETIHVIADDSNKRIWTLEVYFSLSDMPLGKFAKFENLEIQLQGSSFQTYHLDYSGADRGAVNSCLEQSYSEASNYVNIYNEEHSPTSRNAPECTAVVVKRSFSVGSDGAESERCFPALKAGDPPICETPVAPGTILRPSQIWLKDGVRVSVCEHGGNCYPAQSVKFDAACDDPRSVGYFEVD